ncbi:hypothetical protein ABID16_002745 [Rhizobium aquaticum]|uniref:Uncharacterized protein n=1 Tax=Rhizobium aquaticum TaxID=1549636 RepID=A0ABV2J117_9HYPH
MFKYSVAAAVAGLALSTLPVQASTNSVVAGCSAGGNCVALVQAEIARYRGTPAQKDRAIANLVAALAGVANGSNDKAIAGAIAFAGSQSSNSGQQQQIAQIANTVSTGAPQTTTAAVAGQQASAN